MNDFGQFRGWTSQILTYIISHRMLVLRLCSPETSAPDAFLMCYYCSSLPQRLEWKVEQLEVYDVTEQLRFVVDRRAGISFCCGKIQTREHFDLREYLAVTPATTDSERQSDC